MATSSADLIHPQWRTLMVEAGRLLPGYRIRLRKVQVLVERIEEKEKDRSKVRIHAQRIPDGRNMRSKILSRSDLVPVFLSGEAAEMRMRPDLPLFQLPMFTLVRPQLSKETVETVTVETVRNTCGSPQASSNDRDQVVVVMQNFISSLDIARIVAIGESPHALPVTDRAEGTSYHHEVFRIENQLRRDLPATFWRLLNAAWALDRQQWEAWERRGHGKTGLCFPEIEYIVYDVKRLGRPGSFDTHVDNRSLVTAVVLLSDRDEFSGGVNFFELRDARGGSERRRVELAAGDAIFFRGEEVMHGLEPVTAGRRSILQLEMSLCDEHAPKTKSKSSQSG